MATKNFSNKLVIKFIDSPEEAPNYGSKWVSLKATEAHIISRGMTSGVPTVDLQFTDKDGNKYVMLAPGTVFEMLGKAVEGRRKRDEIIDKAVDESTGHTKQ